MKKLSAVFAVALVAVVLALVGVVSVSATSRQGDTIVERLQNQEFYSKSANLYGERSGQGFGVDTVSFAGIKAGQQQMRVTDLFSGQTGAASLKLVHYQISGHTLTVDQADLPAGVTHYSVKVADAEDTVTVSEIKNGVPRTKVGHAISSFTANLALAQTKN